MSKWEWRETGRPGSGWVYTGLSRDVEAQVCPIAFSVFWALEAHYFDREAKEAGFVNQNEAKAAAERWLDEREAEAENDVGAAMTDFGAPHPDCTGKHTKYQPGEKEWICPKCGDDGEFYIYVPADDAHPECIAIHVDDDVACSSNRHGERQRWSGHEVATMLEKKANVVPCSHCKGTGFVNKEDTQGAA